MGGRKGLEKVCLGNMFHQMPELLLREKERLCHLRGSWEGESRNASIGRGGRKGLEKVCVLEICSTRSQSWG